MTTSPKRRRSTSDVLYHLFGTLPAIVVLIVLGVLAVIYGLIRLVLP